jgi:preprotein translocase subunit SecG
MSILITILISLGTIVLFIDSIFLILLVLIQLPKKEAGAGLAFGGGATDALFGAGSGNALTNITKYSIVLFFALALGLSVVQNHRALAGRNSIEKALEAKAARAAATPAAPLSLNNLLQDSASSLSNRAKPAPANLTPAAPVKTNSAPAAAVPPVATPVVTPVAPPAAANPAPPAKK